MALFTLDLDIQEEYKNMLKDILKMLSILIVSVILQTASSNKNFLSEDIFDIIMYVLIGLMFFHLVLQKIVSIE